MTGDDNGVCFPKGEIAVKTDRENFINVGIGMFDDQVAIFNIGDLIEEDKRVGKFGIFINKPVVFLRCTECVIPDGGVYGLVLEYISIHGVAQVEEAIPVPFDVIEFHSLYLVVLLVEWI